MDNPSISYRPLPDATPESELWCLMNVYAFLLEVSQKHKAVEAAEASETIEQDLRPGAQQAQGVPEDDPPAEQGPRSRARGRPLPLPIVSLRNDVEVNEGS